jgi:hypothetical protein
LWEAVLWSDELLTTVIVCGSYLTRNASPNDSAGPSEDSQAKSDVGVSVMHCFQSARTSAIWLHPEKAKTRFWKLPTTSARFTSPRRHSYSLRAPNCCRTWRRNARYFEGSNCVCTQPAIASDKSALSSDVRSRSATCSMEAECSRRRSAGV